MPKNKPVPPDIQDFYIREEIKASLTAVDRSSVIENEITLYCSLLWNTDGAD